MKCALAAMVVFGALGAATPASADWLWMYGSVVCSGDRALVRFAGAYNEEAPVFSDAPNEFDHGLSRTPIRDPSTCTLRDGRVVRLAHTYYSDATPYGMSGGVNTNVFTLTVGDRVLYRREAIWRRMEPYPALATVIVEPTRVIECRYTRERSDPDQERRPQSCVEAPARLAGLEPEPSRGLPGTLHLDRSASGEEGFCHALVVPASLLVDTPLRAWPAFISSQPVEMIVERFGGAPHRYIDQLRSSGFDLDNDGVRDRPVNIENQDNYIDALLWALPPSPTQERLIMRRDAHDFVDSADTLRAQGWRIYGGDQTAFAEIRYVTLTPIFRFGQTYLHARWAIPGREISDLVMRPHPDGGMDEVCAFSVVPAL